MKKSFFITAATAALLLSLVQQECLAQRTAQKQWMISAGGAICLTTPWPGPSIEMDIGRYTQKGLACAGLVVNYQRHPIMEGISIEMPGIEARLSYGHRIIGSYTRGLNLYLETSANAGVQFPDPYNRLPKWIECDLSPSVPYAGISIGPEMELFLLEKIAAIISVEASARASDLKTPPSVKTSFGIRINI